MQTLVADAIAFLKAHPELATLVIGLTAFAESFAFLSFIFPGFAILVAAGAMVQAGLIDPIPAAAAGAAGALAGDIISYWIGSRSAEGLRKTRLFAQNTEAFDRGERFFKRYGVASVFVGRFFGPLRAFLPLIAGMCRMRFAAFLAVSTVSAAIWAPSLLFSGFLIGTIANNGWSIEQKGLAAGAALAVFAALVWLSKKIFKSS